MRARTDGEVAAALIEIADSRFQPGLIEAARASGKLAGDYALPERARNKLPDRIQQTIGSLYIRTVSFGPYPFGSDLTDTELMLVGRLRAVSASGSGLLGKGLLAWAAMRTKADSNDTGSAALDLLGLARPRGLRERLYRRLVLAALLGQKGAR